MGGAGSATLSIESISPFAWCAETPSELLPAQSWEVTVSVTMRAAFPTFGKPYARATVVLAARARLRPRAMGRGVVRGDSGFDRAAVCALGGSGSEGAAVDVSRSSRRRSKSFFSSNASPLAT
jgi:hypothetical protein